MRFLTSALLLIIASFISSAVAGNVKNNPMKSKYFDFDVADLVDFTIQQAPIDTNSLLSSPQIGANTPINPAAFSSLPGINLQAQPGLNAAILSQMQAQQPLQQGALTPQQYQQLLQQQAAFTNPLVGAQTVMNQLFPQQQQAALNAAAVGYNPYMGMNGYANQFGGYPANNPAGVAGLVQQAAHQIVQAMNPGPGIGGGVNPFGPGVGGIGGVGGPVGGLGGLGGIGGIGGIGGPGPRP